MKLPRFLASPVFWSILIVVWAAVLYWLSSQSQLPQSPGFKGIDKIEHTAYFAIGGTCFFFILRFTGVVRRTAVAVVLTVLFCAVVGALDEWHQTFTPGRSGGDLRDWIADTLGGVIGALFAWAAGRWLTSAGTTTAAAR